MASAIIHISLAHELNKKLQRQQAPLFIGTIAPDISKIIGEQKEKSHFIDQEDNIPNLDMFLKKYKDKLDDDFVLGYYIHLYVDYLWFKYFISEIDNPNFITTKNGDSIKYTKDVIYKYIYNDYSNLNIKLIDYYDLDLKIFYNEIPFIKPIIEEIPMNKLDVVVNKMGEIIENSKEGKEYLIDLASVSQFINTSMEIIYSNLIDLGVLK